MMFLIKTLFSNTIPSLQTVIIKKKCFLACKLLEQYIEQTEHCVKVLNISANVFKRYVFCLE